MRKVAASLFVLVGVSNAFGGIVSFAPDPVVIDPTVSTTASVEVGVSPTDASSISSVDLVIGSSDVAITGFTYTAAFLDDTAFAVDPAPFNTYTHDIYVGGFFSDPVASYAIGSLQIDAAGLAPGLYTVGVSTEIDGFSGMADPDGNPEAASGSFTVQVVPEPASLALLSLGTLGLIRRRFA